MDLTKMLVALTRIPTELLTVICLSVSSPTVSVLLMVPAYLEASTLTKFPR